MGLLLDTCAAVWIFEKLPISRAAANAFDRAIDQGEPVYVSPVTAWELGMLVSRGRLTLSQEPLRWFEEALREPALKLAKIPPSILIASSFLPGNPPRDPADRIFAATARANGWRLVTRDRQLLDYARDGHLDAVTC